MHARDIRKLDNVFSVSNEPSIELRNQAILVNAGELVVILPCTHISGALSPANIVPDPIRAVIMRNACLVFVPDGADSLLLMLQTSFHNVMQLESGISPYEFK